MEDPFFSHLSIRGHEIALHFHEDFHIPNANRRPIEDWVDSFQKEMDVIEGLSGKPVLTWSGGNLYPNAFAAAAQAGLKVDINYKNPKTQEIDQRFMILTPWRPAGAKSIEERTTHDPNGSITYIPSGVYPAHCQSAEVFPRPYKHEAFDFVTIALRNSVDAVSEGKVNTFIATLHPGDFKEPEDDAQEFAVWEEWLTRIVDPLVKSGRLVWATVGEMAGAFKHWEDAQKSQLSFE